MQASSTSSDSDDMENFIPTKHPTTGTKLSEVCTPRLSICVKCPSQRCWLIFAVARLRGEVLRFPESDGGEVLHVALTHEPSRLAFLASVRTHMCIWRQAPQYGAALKEKPRHYHYPKTRAPAGTGSQHPNTHPHTPPTVPIPISLRPLTTDMYTRT